MQYDSRLLLNENIQASSSSPSLYANRNNYRSKIFGVLLAITLLIIFLVTDYFNIGLKHTTSYLILGNLNLYTNSNLTIESNSSKASDNHEQESTGKCKPIYSKNKQYTVKLEGISYPQYVPIYFNKSINFKCLNQSSVTKKILLWNTFFGSQDYSYGLGKLQPFIKNNCPVTNCELMNDRARVGESDLVIVHMRDSITNLPTSRPPNQRWV
jgi:hypothetical protein